MASPGARACSISRSTKALLCRGAPLAPGAPGTAHGPLWSTGRITLAGDAGYCPSPSSGQGTSLALVGAFVLARQLAPSPADPQAAFTRYSDRRRPFVLINQDMVTVERKQQIPDDVFERTKNGIVLDDLVQP